MLPDICLHADSIEGVLPEKCEPGLHPLQMAVFDLNQTAKSYPLKILLALFVDEVTSDYGPAFNHARQRHRTGDGEVEIVGGAEGKVCEKIQILNAIRSQLKIADWETIFSFPS